MSKDEAEIKVQDFISYVRFNEQPKYTEKDWLLAIETILNLYQEDEEIIKRLNTEYETAQGYIVALKKMLEEEKEKNKELDEKLKISIAMLTKGTYPETEKGANDFDNYFISKDKIKKILQEIDIEYVKAENTFNSHFEKVNRDMQDYYIQKEATSIMQELSWIKGRIEELLEEE